MGRPIKKKFFGNLNVNGVGGEGVASVTSITNAVSTQSVTVSFSAPAIAGGATATGTVVKTGNTVTNVTITSSGSGYLTAPTVTFTGTNMTTQGSATAVLTSTRPNGIAIVSYLSTGSSAIVNGDILKQESSKRYLVKNAQGVGQCKLVAGAPTAGQMNIIAADSTGATYYVTKLTAHKARLVNKTNTSTALYASGTVAPWNITTAAGAYVTLNHTI